MHQFETQFKALQWVLRQLPRGYHYWQVKDVSEARLNELAALWAEHYGTDLVPRHRTYRKSKGLAAACAASSPLPQGGHRCILLAGDGVGPIRENRKLRDGRNKSTRPTWGDYVLHEATRPKEMGGGLHWSWYLTPRVQSQIESYLVTLIKTGKPDAVAGFWHSCLQRPLFAGVRSALTRILRSNQKLWSACWPGKPWPGPIAPLPAVPGFR